MWSEIVQSDIYVSFVCECGEMVTLTSNDAEWQAVCEGCDRVYKLVIIDEEKGLLEFDDYGVELESDLNVA